MKLFVFNLLQPHEGIVGMILKGECMVKWFIFATKWTIVPGTLHSNEYGDEYIFKSTNWNLDLN
jgi:hypothetical protein